MKFFTFACLAASAAAHDFSSETVAKFEEFKATFAREYASADEEHARLAIFAANMERAEELSAMGDAEFGVTKFADLTAQEFKQFLNYIPSLSRGFSNSTVSRPTIEAAPANYDWRDTKGVVSAVKDQGNCGSCWAYSTTEAIESQWVLAGNDPVVLSAQQIISCDHNGDEGCNGGDTLTAYKYVEKAGGMATEADYPETSYKTGRSGTCKRFAHPTVGKISGYTWATKECAKGACNDQDEDTMAANVASTGPASICVNAEAWQLYSKGVMSAKHCGGHAADDLDHCVQVVGYSGYSQNADDAYWIVRNSWNTDWGIDGYIHVQLGENACGIANEATFPTVAK